MMNKTQISIQFDQMTGIRHIGDFDELCVPRGISEAAKNTVVNELNFKMHKYRISKGMLCFIPIGFILFVIGGFTAMWIFPINFIFTFLGILCIFMYPIYVCKKRANQSKMLKYVADLVECRTHGIIRIEYNYDFNFYQNRRRVGTRRVLRSMTAKVIESKLVFYNQNNVNNYNNINGVRNPHQNPMYPQGYNEPLIPQYNINNNNQHYPQPPPQNPQQNPPPQYPQHTPRYPYN